MRKYSLDEIKKIGPIRSEFYTFSPVRLVRSEKYPQPSYKNVVVAMQERFEPQSKRDLYLAEFQVRCKKRTETWADYGEDLRILVDKAYPTLDDDARQQLALQRYLSQLQDEQVAFGVKQRKPKTIEAAVAATLGWSWSPT